MLWKIRRQNSPSILSLFLKMRILWQHNRANTVLNEDLLPCPSKFIDNILEHIFSGKSDGPLLHKNLAFYRKFAKYCQEFGQNGGGTLEGSRESPSRILTHHMARFKLFYVIFMLIYKLSSPFREGRTDKFLALVKGRNPFEDLLSHFLDRNSLWMCLKCLTIVVKFTD